MFTQASTNLVKIISRTQYIPDFNMAQLPPSVAQSLEETKVEYRLLGRSGLRVSVPIVGCMSIGNPEWADWVLGPEKALPLLKAAYDAGVNTASEPSNPTF